jgi:hypothetical protein
MPKFTYGCDPYNTADAPQLNERIVRNFHGPLGAIAYRCQASWDFTPGSPVEKLAYWEAYGMHRLPLLPLPSLLQRQAE